ncbi:MAG: class I tRNA ligase family protein, partial [Candidatus Bathyarchaeia archaeon]
ISRQRIYGTPIPFWYCDTCNAILSPRREDLPVIPENTKPPVDICPRCSSTDIRPSFDVCDCWVDSSITPLINSGFFEDKARHSRHYPLSMRQQGHDIIRTWLFYTTLRCLLLTGEIPFRDAVINGHILGPDGTKMSKSKGNVVSPEKGLESFGADSLRLVLLSFTMGSDFPFKWESVRYCKSFLQKYWSSSRFAAPFFHGYNPCPEDSKELKTLDLWILAHLVETVKAVTRHMDAYQFHLAIESFQNFFWHSFCDQYLEAVKHRLYNPKDVLDVNAAKYTLYTVLLDSTLLLAPFSPHITEEVYQTVMSPTHLTVHASRWPDANDIPFDEVAKDKGDIIIKVVSLARSEKSRKGVALNAEIQKVTVKGKAEILDVAREAEDEIRSILRIRKMTFQPADTLEIDLE